MFSKSCEYAIKIMIHLTARAGEGRAGLFEISKAIDSPRAFTAKVLQMLTNAGLLDSARGPGGGYRIIDQKEVNLHQIVEAVDGDGLMVGCVLGFKECSDDYPCPVHHRFLPVREYLSGTLSTTSLKEMNEVISHGRAFLKEANKNKG
ncbi:RrF2 family transcriptional regulator [Halocola ammonii]